MLKEEWTGDRGTAVPVATHVVEMRERLAASICKCSQESTEAEEILRSRSQISQI